MHYCGTGAMARLIYGKCHLGIPLQFATLVSPHCGQGALRVGGGGGGRGVYSNLEDKVFYFIFKREGIDRSCD